MRCNSPMEYQSFESHSIGVCLWVLDNPRTRCYRRQGSRGKSGTKDSTIREEDIPVSTFVGVATGTGGVLDEEVDGKTPVGIDGDQGWWKPPASKWAARVAREEPWVAMVGRPWETEWTLTTADNDCYTIAEIRDWMAWITDARN